MTTPTLHELVTQAGDPISFLRAHKYNRTDLSPEFSPNLVIPQVPSEFSRWEFEQRAWREGVALIDQSHHMRTLFVEGRDAKKLLGRLSCNSLFKSTPDRASQIMCVNEDGKLIGDGIVFQLDEFLFSIVGSPACQTWVEYHVSISDLDVRARLDHRSPVYANGNANTRAECRFQIQGPLAIKVIEKLNNGPLGDVKFFGMTKISIAGIECRALRHGMAAAMGLELWGPWELREAIREGILEAGREFGIALVGAMAYMCSAVESGWYQAIVPAFFGADAVGYQKWSASDPCASVMLWGSKLYDTIEGYYRSPFDIGLGGFVNLDNDCIGRDALAAMDKDKAFKKVSLAWNVDDASDLFREMLTPGGKDVRFIHLPSMADKVGYHYDELRSAGEDVGISAFTAYSANERTVISLALVDPSIEFGDEVEITWGEAGGGYGNWVVPANDLVKIRATVSPTPFAQVARDKYRSGKMA